MTFCMCAILDSNKICDHSLLNGTTIWEGSWMQISQYASVLEYMYISCFYLLCNDFELKCETSLSELRPLLCI